MHAKISTLPLLQLSAVLGCLLGLSLVASAHAAVPGIHDDQLAEPGRDVEARAGLIEASGARVVKVDVVWSQIATRRPTAQTDPSDPVYRFESLDAVVGALATRNITPLFTVYSTPRWAARSGAVNDTAAVPKPAAFGRFMQALAHRYSGRYVDITRGTIPRVRHYEIWNEPNNARFLKPQSLGTRNLALSAYVSLVRAAYPRVKKVNPQAVVIAGSTAPVSRSTRSGTAARDWLEGLVGSRAGFDAYSLHLSSRYAPRDRSAPYPHWGSLSGIGDVLDSVERREGVPIYVTEAGYATQASRRVKTSVSADRQARYLRQIFALPIVRSDRVPLVVWSNLQDSEARSAGLFATDGSQKSSFAPFAGETRRRQVLPSELRR